MRTYKITYLANSDYCGLVPSDPECQTTVEIEAESKAEAIRELHDRFEFANLTGVKCESYNKFPEVWEVVDK